MTQQGPVAKPYSVTSVAANSERNAGTTSCRRSGPIPPAGRCSMAPAPADRPPTQRPAPAIRCRSPCTRRPASALKAVRVAQSFENRSVAINLGERLLSDVSRMNRQKPAGIDIDIAHMRNKQKPLAVVHPLFFQVVLQWVSRGNAANPMSLGKQQVEPKSVIQVTLLHCAAPCAVCYWTNF